VKQFCLQVVNTRLSLTHGVTVGTLPIEKWFKSIAEYITGRVCSWSFLIAFHTRACEHEQAPCVDTLLFCTFWTCCSWWAIDASLWRSRCFDLDPYLHGRLTPVLDTPLPNTCGEKRALKSMYVVNKDCVIFCTLFMDTTPINWTNTTDTS